MQRVAAVYNVGLMFLLHSVCSDTNLSQRANNRVELFVANCVHGVQVCRLQDWQSDVLVGWLVMELANRRVGCCVLWVIGISLYKYCSCVS